MNRHFDQLTQGQRKLVVSVVLLAAAFGVAYLVSQFIIANDTTSLGLIVGAVAALVVVVKILNDWRQGLYIFFAWLFFEDFFRKYLGNNMAVYFAKDALVLVLFVSFFLVRRNRVRAEKFRPPFLAPLLIFFWFAALQVFNPGASSLFYGFLGLKLYFLYVPLMYVGYALIDSEIDLRRFFLFNAVLLLIVGGLGIAQSIIGPTFLNPGDLQEDIRELSTLYRTSPLTGLKAYRPSSVFVSTGRFQNLIVASWMIMLGFGSYLLLRSKKGRVLAYSAIAVLAGASVMSTSRGVVMWCGGSTLVIVAGFLWGAPWRQGEATRVLRSVQRIALLGGLMLVAISVIFPEQVASRFAIYAETLSPTSSASELAARTRDYPLRNFLGAFSTPRWPYGYGTGTGSLGIQYVARILRAPRIAVGVENGYGQLVIEMGVLGLLLWLILGISICVSAWKIVKRLRGSPWFPLAFVIFWFAFMLFFPMCYSSMGFYQDFLIGAYFWILIGILFKLPKVALSAQFAVENRVAERAAAGALEATQAPATGTVR